MKRVKHCSLGLLIISTLLLSGCYPYSSVQVKTQHQINPNTTLSLYFSDVDRARIRHYYVNHYGFKKVPPGHLKRKGRPFQRNKALPSFLRYQSIPYELDRQLRPLPQGYIRIRVGEDIAIMNTRTRVIYDVMWFFDQ